MTQKTRLSYDSVIGVNFNIIVKVDLRGSPSSQAPLFRAEVEPSFLKHLMPLGETAEFKGNFNAFVICCAFPKQLAAVVWRNQVARDVPQLVWTPIACAAAAAL